MSEDLPSSGRLQEASAAEISRRLFLSTAGTAGIVAAIGSREPAPAADVSPETSQMEGTIPVTLRINGQERRLRVDPRTTSAGELEEFLRSFEFPLVAHLRATQVYVHCARDGLTVFDLPRSRAEQDWDQWRPLTRWIARQSAVKNA